MTDRSKNLGKFLHQKKSETHSAKPKAFVNKPGHAAPINPLVKFRKGMNVRKK